MANGNLRPGLVTVVCYVDRDGGSFDAALPGLLRPGLAADRLQFVVVLPNPAAVSPAIRELGTLVASSGDAGGLRRAGAEAATGQYLAFVPGSAALGEGELAALVEVLERSPSVGAVAPGAFAAGAPRLRRVLAAPRGVLLVRTAAWWGADGFVGDAGDLDDLELGWRLNLVGYDVVLRDASGVGRSDGRAVGDTAIGRPIAAQAAAFRRIAYRCFGPRFVADVLPALLGSGGDTDGADWVPGPSDRTARAAVQASRVRSDAELQVLIRPWIGDESPWVWDQDLLRRSGGADLIAGRRRILVVTGDTLGQRMAGPAIRAWEMATALAAEHEVVLAALGACSRTSDGFRAEHVSTADLRRWEQWCDVLVFQGFLLTAHPWIADSDKVLVADLYDPIHLEVLEQDRAKPLAARRASVEHAVSTVNTQLRRADFFLCASGKQRDLWLGHLASLGRINPLTYEGDENLERLIAVAPFGLSGQPPVHETPAIKGVVPGIGVDDPVVLWGGGIYNWFDPLTLLRAIDIVRVSVPNVRLYFLGVKHPNPAVPAMRMAHAAQELARELGLWNTHAFFNESWVAYGDRQNYLCEADIGVSCHYSHVETAFSFRTRILDYLWASLPIVTTEGDAFGDLVTAEGLGVAVPPEDVDELAAALLKVLQDSEFTAGCRDRVGLAAERFTWEKALAPLVEFCRAPRIAPDRVPAPRPDPTAGLGRPPRDWRREWALARGYLAAGGVREVARRVRGRLFKNR